ncbi:MAG: ATP-dependent Clp protease adaptor ClpS [Calditrichaeota bacterium]|nr:MAG: ATP-dependent Clp protease adaptor ClpS [Calditrichota bacterium]
MDEPELPDLEEEVVVDETTSEKIDEPWKVILYNDDIHTFDEVILQLRKATGCTEAEAEKIAFEAHFKGKAVAYSGPFEKCYKVAGVLREIQLVVEIEG